MKIPDLLTTTFAFLCGAPSVQGAVQGFDISHYQPTVDFAGAYASGARFVIIKATEGTTYTDPSFSAHYEGATTAGLLRGGYHFARPDVSTGAAQADFFLAHGGGWTGDGRTLPGMLDLEANPYGSSACYGLDAGGAVAWVGAFVDAYRAATGTYPLIYTSRSWWAACTGDSDAFAATCPLVLARWGDGPGVVPGGWAAQTIWQNADTYAYGGDSDVFNGDAAQLQALADG